MISTYLAMQNAILSRNIATSKMMQCSNAMLSSLSFGNSQPLRPTSALTADVFELQGKSYETKVAALQSLINALEESMGKKIKNSTPKYSGVDYKA